MSAVPAPARLSALLAALRPTPLSLDRLASQLQGWSGAGAFRRIVELAFAGEERAAIMAAGDGGEDRESARIWEFTRRFDERHFPIYEACEYEGLVGAIPVMLFGWQSDAFHDLRGCGTGELLLLALHEDVIDGYRPALLDRLEELGVPRALLGAIPAGGVPLAILRDRLAGGPFAAAVEAAEWAHGGTGLFFLDCTPEYDTVDLPWTAGTLAEIGEEWRLARALMDRVGELARSLTAAPAARFAGLLRAVLWPDPPPDAAVASAPVDGAGEDQR